PMNLVYAFVGVFIGTLIGVLPGIGPAATISMLLPVTYSMSPVAAIIMLSGIFYGAMYGGSTTSILVNIPGEAASIVTCFDGYQMARKGRAGPALGISAIGSFVAGTLSVIGLMIMATFLAKVAIRFGPPEYVALISLGLVVLMNLAQGPLSKTIQMALLGFTLSYIGTDICQGTARFTLGSTELLSGINLIPLVMGLFGISEVLLNMEEPEMREIFKTKIGRLLPTLRDWADSWWPMVRGTVIGFFLGILPGGGSVLSTFVSYTIEKKLSRHPEKFGTGVIEGVAAPEAANNAATGGAFIPLFALGIPCNVMMALFIGALMIHGVQPGPLLIKQHPDVFWGTVASMYIGNGMLLLLNLPLIGMWVKLLKVPYSTLFPLILLFTLIGSYSTSNNTFDVYMLVFFGVLGYLLRKLGYELAPLVFAFVLGPMFENNLRQSLILSDGSFLIFLSRPISAICILIAAILLLISSISVVRTRRERLTRGLE
ncbi:MAG TPA: tripartite tricarboxylate transporter permease, partial [Syntrophorhabdaceae bacterium]|nr:tripartite tricarboxylate transporter permease [Syntrophorhabdaceae bacterium]